MVRVDNSRKTNDFRLGGTMLEWLKPTAVPRVAEGVIDTDVMALKAQVKDLQADIHNLNNLKAQIDEVLLDWARYKTQLRRLAGQITKAAALDAAQAEVANGKSNAGKSVEDLTREEIANL